MPFSQSNLSNLIGEIYDAGLAANWAPVLDQIIELLQVNKAFFFFQQLKEKSPVLVQLQTNFDYSAAVMLDYQTRPWEDPLYQVTKTMSEGDTLYLNNYIDMQEHEDSEFYRNVLVPMRSYYAMASILCRDGENEAPFAVARWKDEKPFSESEFSLFQLLTPHLRKALHIYRDLRLYRGYASISKSILEQTDKAIIVCGSDAEILLSNAFAKERLSTINAVSLSNGKVSLTDKQLNHTLLNAIRHCVSLSYKQIAIQKYLFVDDSVDEALFFEISPMIGRKTLNDFQIPCCLISVKLQSQVNWQLFRKEYSLTPKEQALVKQIYARKSLKEISLDWDVSYNTLRVHIQNILNKVNVGSQTELMQVLTTFGPN